MADHYSLADQLGLSAIKVAPPAAVTAYALLANGLPIAVTLLTLIYLVLQIGHLIWNWQGQAAKRRAEEDAAEGDD